MSTLLSRRSILAGSLAAAAATGLAACGGSGGSQGSSGEDGNTLTVWTWDPNFNIYAMKEAEKIYKKDHSDFSLNIVEMSWDDVQQKITTLAQSQKIDQLPDIFLMQNMAAQKNIINYPDVFSDLEDSGIDFSQFPESVVNFSVEDKVHYALPFDSGTAVLALRTDLLEQAGLSIKDFTDITWTKFIELGKTVLDKTGKPMLSGRAGASDLIMMMVQSAGASMFNDDGTVNIKDNKALLKAAETYKELVDSKVFLEVNADEEYIKTFTSGQVAGVLNGIWISGSIQEAKDQSGNWMVTNIPSLDGVDGATNYTANGGSSWVISANADYELAADFLKSTFAGSTEFYDTILPSSGAIANWIPAGESKVYQEPLEFYGGQAVYADVVEYGTKVPAVHVGVYHYEARDAVSSALTEIVGGKDPATAMAEAQETVEFAMS
ncbi:ABC transporter substrate-binding protein [Actinomyces bowdenii]|uniref:Extracellular solute-binding protein n=1 Tax=Actinomyces bowdenii TaxID=131109 RepID=A0A853EJS9_9ACTO|nr:extracellular solute-binding protein [Actinomyces bowdenii]MBF0696289.1 extracellular solute-binding protein [Actinomyces bowdenii]MCR2052426.1 extracellular solute-binding protein [Actinomyces bowdenii]MDO5064153.1 extracellular solute-binding protein [Actinomyces bowdenii]NYS68462.1 extracellular solute-binding protein [Actinomyces bowdenii]